MPESIQNLLLTASSQLAATSDSAMLDAEVLLCHCLHKNRSYLRAWPDKQPDAEQCRAFQALMAKRLDGWPVAYLIEQREFWSRNFKVSPAVLIPRPDSELMIELCLPLLPEAQPVKIIDLGTGSGILAITLAAERPQAQVIATDISSAALKIATENATALNIHNISFQLSNWFANITEQNFDLIISNPPYIADHDPHLQQGDVRFEPQSALISADCGLQDIRLLAEQARHHLKNQGRLLIEHGYNQQVEVQAIFAQCNYQQISTHTDLSGQPRITSGLWILR
jgi:release factor glutamine methyltransferase